jgi:hypothetical protein
MEDPPTVKLLKQVADRHVNAQLAVVDFPGFGPRPFCEVMVEKPCRQYR